MSVRIRRCRHIDGRFRQPTDVAWDPRRQYLYQRRLHQLARRQGQQGRRLGQVLGQEGQGPTASSTRLHTIASDANDNIYVGDRGNRRVQVFDTEGNLKYKFSIDLPPPPDAKPAIGNMPNLTNYLTTGGTQTPGAPWAICITPPGPTTQVAFISDCLPGPHLQGRARRQGARLDRQVRQAAQAVRLDPPDRLPVGERNLRRRKS